MRTQEMLDNLPANHFEYLKTLRSDMANTETGKQRDLIREHARGYIRCLVDCGVVKDFKAAWCWFCFWEGGRR